MHRFAVLIAVLAVAATACGAASGATVATSTDRLRLEVVPQPDPLISGRPAAFELAVTNVSDRGAVLRFDTTQRGDVRLSVPEGVEVYHWSERRVFAQEPAEVAVAPGRHVTFALDEAELPVAPGEYEVFATLVGIPKLQVAHATVTVVEGDESTQGSG